MQPALCAVVVLVSIFAVVFGGSKGVTAPQTTTTARPVFVLSNKVNNKIPAYLNNVTLAITDYSSEWNEEYQTGPNATSFLGRKPHKFTVFGFPAISCQIDCTSLVKPHPKSKLYVPFFSECTYPYYYYAKFGSLCETKDTASIGMIDLVVKVCKLYSECSSDDYSLSLETPITKKLIKTSIGLDSSRTGTNSTVPKWYPKILATQNGTKAIPPIVLPPGNMPLLQALTYLSQAVRTANFKIRRGISIIGAYFAKAGAWGRKFNAAYGGRRYGGYSKSGAKRSYKSRSSSRRAVRGRSY